MRSISRPAPRLTARAAWAVAAGTAVLLLAACGSTASGPGTPVTPRSGTPGSGPPGTAASATPAVHSGTAQATPASPAPASGQPSCDPRLTGPIGVSFVSASDGFLLGITLSDCAASTGSKILLRQTTDGGLHWTALPAPPAPWGGVAPDGNGRVAADGVTSVLFADARDGWAYGPGLWATHDGGATWQQVDAVGGRVVQDMAASGGQVLATLESCDPYNSTCDSPYTLDD